MRLSPRPPTIDPKDGFTPDNDIFGYADFGERLANLVHAIDQPLTLLLDGPWGSGKSVFARQWAGHLRTKGAAVVEFNAFSSDHHEDAFVVLAAEIVRLAKEHLGTEETQVHGVLQSAKKLGASLLPVAMRVAIKAGTLGVVDKDDVEAVKALAKDVGEEAGKAAERAISDRLQAADKDRAMVETFQCELKKIASAISENANENNEYPLVFIIDELDRCRPPFALNVLERIKHFFSVPGVTFVLITNLDQLSGAVRGAYGQDTDGRLYLEKFYDLRVKLPSTLKQNEGSVKRYLDYLWHEMNLGSGNASTDDEIKFHIVSMAGIYNLNLRTVERIATHLALYFTASGNETFTLSTLVAGLATIRQVAPELYEKARQGKMTWDDAQRFFMFDQWSKDTGEWDQGWWKYITSYPMSSDALSDYERTRRRYNFPNRSSFLIRATALMDNYYFPDDKN